MTKKGAESFSTALVQADAGVLKLEYSKMKLRHFFLTIAAGLLVNTATAQVNTTLTTIKEIYSYAVAGDGDALIVPEHPREECDGFWMDSADPGFNHNLSVMLSAYHAKAKMVIYGDETSLFTGSSNKFCKLTIIRITGN